MTKKAFCFGDRCISHDCLCSAEGHLHIHCVEGAIVLVCMTLTVVKQEDYFEFMMKHLKTINDMSKAAKTYILAKYFHFFHVYMYFF